MRNFSILVAILIIVILLASLVIVYAAEQEGLQGLTASQDQQNLQGSQRNPGSQRHAGQGGPQGGPRIRPVIDNIPQRTRPNFKCAFCKAHMTIIKFRKPVFNSG